MDLAERFGRLQASARPTGNRSAFQTVSIVHGKPHRLAKTGDGHPCVLILTQNPSGALPPPLRLEHLTVQHGLFGTIHGSDSSSEAEYSLIVLASAENELVGAFLRFAEYLADNLPLQPAPSHVATELRRLVEMLQRLRAPGTKAIQGLWAEMLLINQMPDASRWVRAWHNDPMELHDFCIGATRVEVKSSSSRVRKHQCSHHQLCPQHDVQLFIASIFVERATDGVSVFDLSAILRLRLDTADALKVDEIVLATLGVDYRAAREIKFDRKLAERSLLFFSIASVPRLPTALPERVLDVSYAVLLDESDGVGSLALR